jgi:hypothetical protein
MQNVSHFKSLYLFFTYLIASGKWQVAAASPAQMYIDTCVRAKICCRRDNYTMGRKKMKALICDLHHGIMATGGCKRHYLLYTEDEKDSTLSFELGTKFLPSVSLKSRNNLAPGRRIQG